MATTLGGIAAFKVFQGVPQATVISLILLGIDLIIGALSFAIFGNHLRVSSRGWMCVEDAYNGAISHLGDFRVFLARIELNKDLEVAQPHILSFYWQVYLHKDRINMHKAFQHALNSVYSTSYTMKILIRKSLEISELLKKDKDIVTTHGHKFKIERDLLPELSSIFEEYSPEGGEKMSSRLNRIDKFFNSVVKRFSRPES